MPTGAQSHSAGAPVSSVTSVTSVTILISASNHCAFRSAPVEVVEGQRLGERRREPPLPVHLLDLEGARDVGSDDAEAHLHRTGVAVDVHEPHLRSVRRSADCSSES